MDKYSAAYLAASFLTSLRIDEVATTYIDWIDDEAHDGATGAAVATLMRCARLSKNPDRVLALADAAYSDVYGIVGDDTP